MSENHILVDGERVAFRAGESVFQAARRAGAFIPALCFDERLAPGGHCRLCLVEIEGQSRPVASCTQRARPNLSIRTETPRVRALQRTLLEMVLSENPPGECRHCTDLIPCELHQLAARLGVARGRFAGRASGASAPDPNPFIARDYEACIACYRCVRVCAEVEGDFAITAAGRGFDTRIAAPFDRGLEDSSCTFCGQCVQTCPTGALGDRRFRAAAAGAPAAERSAVRSVCTYCGTGCSIDLHAAGGRLVGVTPDPHGAANRGALCVKGQFGFDFVMSPERLTTPLIRERGRLRAASWDEALDFTASRLFEVRERHGADAFYAIASGRSTNEAAYLTQKFARAAIGTHQVDNCARA